MPDRSPNEARRATQEKMDRLKEEGYEVKEMWECQWKTLVQEDEAVKRIVSELERVDPLVPREAFFGGRTGAVSLYHEVDSGEEIHYMDVTSLYPWVNKTCENPLGHPEIKTQVSVEQFSQYFGLAKVDILPPPGLFHPVLPMRCEKLTFPLRGLRERTATTPHAGTYSHLRTFSGAADVAGHLVHTRDKEGKANGVRTGEGPRGVAL